MPPCRRLCHPSPQLHNQRHQPSSPPRSPSSNHRLFVRRNRPSILHRLSQWTTITVLLNRFVYPKFVHPRRRNAKTVPHLRRTALTRLFFPCTSSIALLARNRAEGERDSQQNDARAED